MNNFDILSPSTLCLAHETLNELRADPTETYEPLSAKQQEIYDALAKTCLQEIIEQPRAANLLTKLGPTEEAYSIKLAELDKALLRVHFYTPEGSAVVDPAIMQNNVVDIARFGTPHTHYGNISSAVPVGKLVHYCFSEVEGQNYTAGYLTYREANSNTGKHRQAVVVPHHAASLAYDGSLACDNTSGYRMDRSAIHVISWPEPTVTVFFSDMINPRPTVTYQAFGSQEMVGQVRAPLTGVSRDRVWESFNCALQEVL